MNSIMKPDLGIYFYKKFGKEKTHHFYDVNIVEIIFAGDSLFTFTSYPVIEGRCFAASFDFGLKILGELKTSLRNAFQIQELDSLLHKPFTGPEKVSFESTAINLDITSKIGSPVKSSYEIFIPFIVEGINNVK